MSFGHGTCQLYCGRLASVTVSTFQICERCLELLRAIARSAGVLFDDRLVSAKAGVRMVAKHTATLRTKRKPPLVPGRASPRATTRPSRAKRRNA